MAQRKWSFEDVRTIVSRISFKDRVFKMLKKGDGFLLQLQYEEPDVNTGAMALQKGRKWYISPFSTESEIVQTALKAVITSQEHVAREHFRYLGVAVFHPHFDVNDLRQLAEDGSLDKREP